MQTVQRLTIGEAFAGQRLDNYLFNFLKGVPKSHIYRLVRKGEVRINGGRIQALYKLKAGDTLRVPPVRLATPLTKAPLVLASSVEETLRNAILYEDPGLIILNKPATLASHGGSGLQYGVIEALRTLYAKHVELSLVHRLDQGTSGCLMIAKKRSMLRCLQAQLRERRCVKRYWALVQGDVAAPMIIEAPLYKYVLANGERRVRVDQQLGVAATTRVTPLLRFKEATLLELHLETGRTHQIRVHCMHKGFPILGDEKYGGGSTFTKQRLCLHARALEISLPTGAPLRVQAPLPARFKRMLEMLSLRSGIALDTLKQKY